MNPPMPPTLLPPPSTAQALGGSTLQQQQQQPRRRSDPLRSGAIFNADFLKTLQSPMPRIAVSSSTSSSTTTPGATGEAAAARAAAGGGGGLLAALPILGSGGVGRGGGIGGRRGSRGFSLGTASVPPIFQCPSSSSSLTSPALPPPSLLQRQRPLPCQFLCTRMEGVRG